MPSAGRPWPILAWVPGYQRGWLRADLVAGLTVCAILVPEGMAYAELEVLTALEQRLAAELAAAAGP